MNLSTVASISIAAAAGTLAIVGHHCRRWVNFAVVAALGMVVTAAAVCRSASHSPWKRLRIGGVQSNYMAVGCTSG